jgi:hypothetical protein
MVAMQSDYYIDGTGILVFRREDLLWLTVELRNCELTGDGTALRWGPGPGRAAVYVHLPHQHLLEEPVGDGVLWVPVRSLAAAPATLPFGVPGAGLTLPPGGLLEGLELLDYDHRDSALEFPARLNMWPDGTQFWSLSHPPALAVTPEGVTAGLWQARLGGWQEGWRHCTACGTLVYARDAPGLCNGGGTHRHGEGAFSLQFGGHASDQQGGWYRCGRCQGLYYAGFDDGRCYGEVPHVRTDDYGVPYGTTPPGTEPGWRWCSRCQLMFYLYADSLCVSGEPHDPNGSSPYSVGRGPSLAGTRLIAGWVRDGDTPFELSPSTYDLQQFVNGLFDAPLFALSALGASVRMAGPVGYRSGAEVDPGIAYEHHAEFGRDVRVSVTQRGYLTTRHPASVVTVTERRFGWRTVPNPPPERQDMWDWCYRCASLAFGGGPGGRCADGNPHNLGPGPPMKMVPTGLDWGTDPGWAWCSVCESLTKGGTCWSGDDHDTADSMAYYPIVDFWASWLPTVFGGTERPQRCNRCGRLVWRADGACIDGDGHMPQDSIFVIEDVPTGGTAVAYLHRYSCLVVTEPEVACGALGEPNTSGWREMPLRRLRLRTLWVPLPETPPEGEPFWVRSGTGDALFAMEGSDWEGRTVAFSMPLVFVPETVADDGGWAARVYADGPPSRRTRPFGGQVVALADPPGSSDGSTAVPVVSMDFTLKAADGMRPAYRLTVAGFTVAIAALNHFAPDGAQPHQVTLHDRYKTDGLGEGNPAGAFLRLVKDVPVGLAAERVGGLASPQTALGALTTLKGIVPQDFAEALPAPNLEAIFGGAKLLGIVSFASVIEKIAEAPTMLTRRLGETVQIEYRLHATLKAGAQMSLSFGAGATLDLTATTSTSALGAATGTPPASMVKGTVTDVSISIANIVTVHFHALHFTAENGRSPQISTDGCDVTFDGDLAFLRELVDKLPKVGFGPGTTVDVTPAGLEAGYALAVPAAAVGVFALSNLALSVRLTLPFSGAAPKLRFAFSHRDHPFTVGVLFLAGTGYFALAAQGDDRGVTELEAALEFGGNCEIDVFVARGGVYAMAGIYIAKHGDKSLINGYVRCGGYLEILGVISISIDFRMGLTYEPASGDVVGAATLTVGISILFFSKTVTFSVERRFAGPAPAAGARSEFRAVSASVDADAWNQHCQAFA